MAFFSLTVIDQEKGRVTHYNEPNVPIVIAAQNPATIDDFAEKHDLLTGWPLYREGLSEKEFEGMSERGLQDYLTEYLTRGYKPLRLSTPLHLHVLQVLATTPDYADYSTNSINGKTIGRQLVQRNGLFNFDGVMLIDLRKKEIGIKGKLKPEDRKMRKKDDPSPQLIDTLLLDPNYQCFGRLSSLRRGEIIYHEGSRYLLGSAWRIKDLRNGREY